MGPGPSTTKTKTTAYIWCTDWCSLCSHWRVFSVACTQKINAPPIVNYGLPSNRGNREREAAMEIYNTVLKSQEYMIWMTIGRWLIVTIPVVVYVCFLYLKLWWRPNTVILTPVGRGNHPTGKVNRLDALLDPIRVLSLESIISLSRSLTSRRELESAWINDKIVCRSQ